MRVPVHNAVVAVGLALSLAACGTTSSLNKPGFYTEVKDGRLRVFRDGSKDLAEFKRHGEPAKHVTRIGGGPNGMTIKSSDARVIDEYMAPSKRLARGTAATRAAVPRAPARRSGAADETAAQPARDDVDEITATRISTISSEASPHS